MSLTDMELEIEFNVILMVKRLIVYTVVAYRAETLVIKYHLERLWTITSYALT